MAQGIQIQTGVGPQIINVDGGQQILRQGRDGELVVQDAHGRYYEQSFRGNLFVASNVATQAVSVGLTPTYTGLCISNPIGVSAKNLSILGVNIALTVAPAGIASLHLIAGFSSTVQVVHTAALAAPGIQNCLIGSGLQSVAKADTQATIVNPGYLISLGSGFTAAALYATTPAWIDLAGLFTIPPGGWIALGALTAVTGFASFVWEER